MNYIFSMGTHNIDENYRGIVQSILDEAAGILVEKSQGEDEHINPHLTKFDSPADTSTIPDGGYVLYLLGFGTLHEFQGYREPNQMVTLIDNEMAVKNAESAGLLQTVVDKAVAIYLMPFAVRNQNMMVQWHYQSLRELRHDNADGGDMETLMEILMERGLPDQDVEELRQIFIDQGIDLDNRNASEGLSFGHRFKQSFARGKNLYMPSGPLELDNGQFRTPSWFALHHPLVNIQNRDGWFLL